MSYVSIKTIKGRKYAYRQESVRVNGKVVTKMLGYLGAVNPIR